MQIFTRLSLAVLAVLLTTAVRAQNIVVYTPASTTGAVTPNVTAGTLNLGNGISASTACSGTWFQASSYSTLTTAAAAEAANEYWEFTVTPTAGNQLNLTQVSVTGLRASTTGPQNQIWAYKIGTGAWVYQSTPTASGSGNCSSAGNTNNWDFPDFQSTSTVTFRLLPYGATNTGGTHRLGVVTLNGTASALACTPPTTQASAITFPSVASNSLNVNWTNGNGAGRVVVMNTANTFTAPTDGSNPAANTVYSGSGQQVVYNGTGSGPVTVTGLSASTTYYFRVYEYCSTNRNYQTAAGTNNPNSQATVAAAPTITTTAASFGPLCNGTSNNINIAYTTTGTFTGTFTAQLSDASGSFAAPTAIGSGASPITASIPAGTPAGTGYRVRIVNDNPATNGSNNGSNIVIANTPGVPNSTVPPAVCAGTAVTVTGAGAANATGYTYWTAMTGGSQVTTSTTPAGTVSGGNLTTSTGLAAGSYTYYVQAENGSCSGASRQAVTVTIQARPLVDLGSDATYCAGTPFSRTLDAQNTGASYLWNDGTTAQTLTATTAGTYSVTVTANGCSATDAVTVTENALPVVNLGNDAAYCAGTPFSLTLDAQNTGAAYLWNDGTTAQTLDVTTAGTYSVTVTDAGGCTGTDAVTITENTAPAVNLGNDAAYCAGTPFSLTLDAQNTGASYLWNDGTTAQTLTATTAGTYSVTVTDINGCTATDAVTVTENALPAVNLGNDAAYCAGTPFSLTLDAQNTGAAYLWNDGTTAQTLTVTTAGTYSVTVTANGCSANDEITITENAAPTVDLGNDAAYCAGTPFSLTLDAQNAGASYLWNGGTTAQTLTVTVAGTYSVTVTVDGCSATDAVTITENALPVVNLGNDAAYCAGTAFSLTLNAQNTGATYLWNGGSISQTLTVTTAGTYSVTVTDAHGCTGTDAITVSENALPTVDLGSDITAQAPPAVLSAGSGFAAYLWQPGGQTTAQISVNQTGTYHVTVTDANGCTASDSVKVTFTYASVTEQTATTAISVYPNPSAGTVYVQMDHNGPVSLDILSINGQTVYTQKQAAYISGQTVTLDLSHLTPGVYILRLAGAGITARERIVIGQ